MPVLIYSPQKCEHCKSIIEFIQSQPALLSVVKLHNIVTHGVPKGVTRVPTLITDDGKVLVGGDVKNFLEELIPFEVEYSQLGSQFQFESEMFNIDMYGKSLAPPMTSDLEQKISRSVQDAYQSIKK